MIERYDLSNLRVAVSDGGYILLAHEGHPKKPVEGKDIIQAVYLGNSPFVEKGTTWKCPVCGSPHSAEFSKNHCDDCGHTLGEDRYDTDIFDNEDIPT